jgi:hypothetical protein
VRIARWPSVRYVTIRTRKLIKARAQTRGHRLDRRKPNLGSGKKSHLSGGEAGKRAASTGRSASDARINRSRGLIIAGVMVVMAPALRQSILRRRHAQHHGGYTRNGQRV